MSKTLAFFEASAIPWTLGVLFALLANPTPDTGWLWTMCVVWTVIGTAKGIAAYLEATDGQATEAGG